MWVPLDAVIKHRIALILWPVESARCLVLFGPSNVEELQEGNEEVNGRSSNLV